MTAENEHNKQVLDLLILPRLPDTPMVMFKKKQTKKKTPKKSSYICLILSYLVRVMSSC